VNDPDVLLSRWQLVLSARIGRSICFLTWQDWLVREELGILPPWADLAGWGR
jgi:hypothetical protein